MKILVVEDDPTNFKLVNLILSSNGHQIFTSDKAGTVLERIKSEEPDLILLDLVLPDMSGVSLAQMLKQDELTSRIPIIAITGYPDKFKQKDISLAGFDAYIVKPISTRTLNDMVEGVYALKKNSKKNNDDSVDL